MNSARLKAATLVAVMVGTGSAVALAAGDPTPTPPPKIAVVARGDGTNFADALAVGSVAGQLGAPVFTTPATFLSDATATALADYNPELVIITGGTAAISDDVEFAIIRTTGLAANQVVRAAGKNRFETAALIATIFDDLEIDPAFLPVGATATDADLLDGLDATAFQSAGNYLAADGKAADSDLLDGRDAASFAPSLRVASEGTNESVPVASSSVATILNVTASFPDECSDGSTVHEVLARATASGHLPEHGDVLLRTSITTAVDPNDSQPSRPDVYVSKIMFGTSDSFEGFAPLVAETIHEVGPGPTTFYLRVRHGGGGPDAEVEDARLTVLRTGWTCG